MLRRGVKQWYCKEGKRSAFSRRTSGRHYELHILCCEAAEAD